MDHQDVAQTGEPDSINEFVITGEFGFLRVDGPFSVTKAGTKWEISVPTDPDDHGTPPKPTQRMILDRIGNGCVLIADGEAVGGGLVDAADEFESEGVVLVRVDQYPRGDVA